jgi:hypothetical protein
MEAQMSRIVVVVSALVLAGAALAAGQVEASSESLVTRFSAKPLRMPVSYKARRHLKAENSRFNTSGWLDVVTELDAGRLTYTVVDRGGSELVQNTVLIPALEGERELFAEGTATFALTGANYRLEEAPADAGVPRIRLTPRREDKRLIDGWMFLGPDGGVLQVSGRLAKSPSFWTKSVTLSQRYTYIDGVHLPISVTSVADVRLVGRSTFLMTYTYELVDGKRVTAGSL